MKRFTLIITFLLMALPGLRGNCANPTLLCYSNPDWQQENFTFLFVDRDRPKALLKNQARMISVIRELYGAVGDSIMLDAAEMMTMSYNGHLKYKNRRYFKQEIIIYFFFNKYTGKLDTVRGFFSLPKTSLFYENSYSEFLEQHFEEIIDRFVKKYHEYYVSQEYDFFKTYYGRLKQEKKWENIYDYYFSNLYKADCLFETGYFAFLRIDIFYCPEFKTGKELLDYICSFEDCPIKTNEDFGVFREDYVK